MSDRTRCQISGIFTGFGLGLSVMAPDVGLAGLGVVLTLIAIPVLPGKPA